MNDEANDWAGSRWRGSAGYIVGPALAGWMLLYLDPVQVFTAVGLMSLLAFIPVLRLTDYTPRLQSPPLLRQQVRDSLKAGSRTPAIWLSGGLEATVYIATYALKAFLPIYGLTAGVSIAVVGLFFSVQEAVSLLLRPLAGRVGDRIGYLNAIAGGMAIVGAPLLLLPQAKGNAGLLAIAALMGCGQAFVFPATTALISDQIDDHYLGAGLGLAGTLNNLGKVIGPILGGMLVGGLGYGLMFRDGRDALSAQAPLSGRSPTIRTPATQFLAPPSRYRGYAASCGVVCVPRLAIHKQTPSTIHRMESNASGQSDATVWRADAHDAFQ